MKVYVFMAQDEIAVAHTTIEGAKSEWLKVRHNYVDTDKCDWVDRSDIELGFTNIFAMAYPDGQEVAWVSELDVVQDGPVIT